MGLRLWDVILILSLTRQEGRREPGFSFWQRSAIGREPDLAIAVVVKEFVRSGENKEMTAHSRNFEPPENPSGGIAKLHKVSIGAKGIPNGERDSPAAQPLFRMETRALPARNLRFDSEIPLLAVEQEVFRTEAGCPETSFRDFRLDWAIAPREIVAFGRKRASAPGQSRIPAEIEVLPLAQPGFRMETRWWRVATPAFRTAFRWRGVQVRDVARSLGLAAAKPAICADGPIAQRVVRNSGQSRGCAAGATGDPAETRVVGRAGSPLSAGMRDVGGARSGVSREKPVVPPAQPALATSKRLNGIVSGFSSAGAAAGGRDTGIRAGIRVAAGAATGVPAEAGVAASARGLPPPEMPLAGPARGRSPAGLRLSAVKTAFCPPGSPGAQVTIRSGRRRRRVVRSPRRPPGRR